jgi:hypothetical protein
MTGVSRAVKAAAHAGPPPLAHIHMLPRARSVHVHATAWGREGRFAVAPRPIVMNQPLGVGPSGPVDLQLEVYLPSDPPPTPRGAHAQLGRRRRCRAAAAGRRAAPWTGGCICGVLLCLFRWRAPHVQGAGLQEPTPAPLALAAHSASMRRVPPSSRRAPRSPPPPPAHPTPRLPSRAAQPGLPPQQQPVPLVRGAPRVLGLGGRAVRPRLRRHPGRHAQRGESRGAQGRRLCHPEVP